MDERFKYCPLISVKASQTYEAETFLAMTTKRVLIIDDEADVRAVVRGCLEDIAGWEVVTADSGKEGLVKVITDSPDAILLDVMMPGMDGLAFLSALRDYAKESSLPVVLLTAKISITESDKFPGLNVKGVIAKPFDPFLLVEQFANLLNWEVKI
ncbi:response regulator [Leptolyngbya ohadii]|uniref:response regulator n=1 Tax=Leptolyngbya ohadii TaxID=1962290 RepID=UPI0021F1E0DE|nr:response regulator [Leptolyngbya ohadii]